MKRRYIGTVAAASCDKTLRVEVGRVFRHSLYGKIVRRTIVCYAHDPTNAGKLGDVVEIVEARPMSKLKRWSLMRVAAK